MMTIYFDINDGRLEIEDTEFGGMGFSKKNTWKIYQKLKKHFEGVPTKERCR